MSKQTTQCQDILAHIKKYGTITPKEAFYRYGCMRLSARIGDLEKQGHQFTRKMITQRTDNGTERYMQYGRA